DLFMRQSALQREIAVARLRQPWRHHPTLRHLGDLSNVLADVRVIEQRKWHHLAGPMTWAAALEDNRRNIAGKGGCGDTARASVGVRTRSLTTGERERQH